MDSLYEQAQQTLLYFLMVAPLMYLINCLQTDSVAGRLLINIIAFIICLTFSWLIIVFCSFMYIINWLFVIMLPAVIGLMLFIGYRLLRERGLDKRIVYLFIGYTLSVFVVTLFARIGTSNNDIRLDLYDTLITVITMRDPEALSHFALNTLMFVPFGALYVMMAPKKKRQAVSVQRYQYARPEYQPQKSGTAAVFLGLTYSGVIESTQLILQMGECDIADVFANGLGAFLGVLAGLIIRRFIR